MIHLGDITKISGFDVPPVDVLVGGSPCQDLSVAGKRAGLSGERSGLFMHQVRIAKEMRQREKNSGKPDELCRPRFLIWENVYGAFSSNFKDGFGDFGAVLEEIARIAEPDFTLPRLEGGAKWTKSGAIYGNGWSIAWRTHDAQYWGVPQRRKRISLVADFGGECAGEILFECKSVSGNPKSCQSERKEVAGDSAKCTGTHDTVAIEGNGQRESHKGDGYRLTDKMYTLNTAEVHGVAYSLEPGIAAREGGHIYENVSGTIRANAGDNQMSVAFVVNDQGGQSINVEDGNVSPTLRAEAHNHEPIIAYGINCSGCANAQIDSEKIGCITASANSSGNNKAAVAYGISSYSSNAMLSDNPYSGIYEADTSRTLDLNGGNPACNQGGIMVCEPKAYTVKVRGGVEVDSKGRKAGKGALIQEELSATLGTSQDQTLFQPICMDIGFFSYLEEMSPTLLARTYKDPHVLISPVPCIEKRYFEYEVDEKSSTLKSSGGSVGNGGDVIVCDVFDGSRWHDYQKFDGVCETVQAHYGSGGGNTPIVVEKKEPICIEMTSTKNTIVEDGICPTLTARMGTGGNQVNAVLQRVFRWIVRRLTPKECERLQGFPDDWTDIGEWIDTKGKKHKQSDSPRYKALGNSIALPFWQWMAERICKLYDRQITVGSLFDGIVGFPLVFERCGAKALWASEIEEFPIAVTKKHFPEE